MELALRVALVCQEGRRGVVEGADVCRVVQTTEEFDLFMPALAVGVSGVKGGGGGGGGGGGRGGKRQQQQQQQQQVQQQVQGYWPTRAQVDCSSSSSSSR